MARVDGVWQNVENIGTISYTCGYCNTKVGPSFGYNCLDQGFPQGEHGLILICPKCNKPTFFQISNGEITPSSKYGDEVEHLPEDIEALYNEARNCISVNAYNSSVLSCRKLLMNIAHSKGAKESKTFVSYVEFLNDNHYTPPESKSWVDHIRKKGNEATHEIPSKTRDDAVELLDFTEMLLKFVYEMPGKMAKHNV